MLASKDVYHKLNTLFQLFQERELSEILQSVELDQKDGNQHLDQTLSHKLEEVEMFTFLLPTLNNQDSTNNNLLKCNLCKWELAHLCLTKKKLTTKKFMTPNKLD